MKKASVAKMMTHVTQMQVEPEQVEKLDVLTYPERKISLEMDAYFAELGKVTIFLYVLSDGSICVSVR